MVNPAEIFSGIGNRVGQAVGQETEHVAERDDEVTVDPVHYFLGRDVVPVPAEGMAAAVGSNPFIRGEQAMIQETVGIKPGHLRSQGISI